MGKYSLDLGKYAEIARRAAAEGCVLLKNEQQALPLIQGDCVAVFGRSAFNYNKSGLGSGGLVNTRYVVGILDALKNDDQISLNNDLLDIYEAWLKENPYDEGVGWGLVPWSQKEMPLERSMVEAAYKKSNVALVIVGRTAGEDQDTTDEAGSYRLTDIEESMIDHVTKVFHRVIVVLNVGNIIDMSWVAKYKPAAVLYAWQGGQEGGNGVADVLTGKVNPCGKLTDTIANAISDYPSTINFGDLERNYYKEDIFVGYRYFETFAKDKVLYPFGFGLSYTTFDIQGKMIDVLQDSIKVEATITNTGYMGGKEVVQVYVEAPQGKLGKPVRTLVGFKKTEIIKPGESYKLTIDIPKQYMASYDDTGATGNKSCYVLEAGTYHFYLGQDVRRLVPIGSYEEKFMMMEKLDEALAPVLPFERMKPVSVDNGNFVIGTEMVPTRTVDLEKRIVENRLEDISYTGDLGYKLSDVYEGRISMDTFIGQLSDEDMACIIRGEGMCSPKVTPGTAAAFGGVTKTLSDYGIPVACCADGPSGIRMDCGTKAFSLPNGTALGCTYDLELVEELFAMLGLELRKNKIDILLGPGINIHRNPLNGRNFEYITEDPFLNGKMAVAQIKGLAEAGVTGTLKHFCSNNQEANRRYVDAIISERALREIYLKGFEMAVKEGGANSIMTSYGPVNGLWTAGSYDLCTTLLRKEWGFDGIVMTDWWAEANVEGEKSKPGNTASMIRAQNDLYMCVKDSQENTENDNTIQMLNKGVITHWEVQRNTANILKCIMQSPSMQHAMGRISQEELYSMKETEYEEESNQDLIYYNMKGNLFAINASHFNTSRGHSEDFILAIEKYGMYDITFKMKSDLGVLAQMPVSIFVDDMLRATVSIQGTEGKWVEATESIGLVSGLNHHIKLFFGLTGLDIDTITFHLIE